MAKLLPFTVHLGCHVFFQQFLTYNIMVNQCDSRIHFTSVQLLAHLTQPFLVQTLFCSPSMSIPGACYHLKWQLFVTTCPAKYRVARENKKRKLTV